MTSGYMKCGAMGCFKPTATLIAQVPLCDEHAEAVSLELGPKGLTRALSETNAVVYYVAWRRWPTVIKIGTTTNLRYRLTQLSSLHDPAKVLVAEPGHYYLESKRHRQFSHLRLPNETELFRWVPQLADHIQDVRATVGWIGGGLGASDLQRRSA